MKSLYASVLVCVFLLASVPPVSADEDNVVVERLTWAGVKISTDRATVFIDAVGRDIWDGNAPEGFVPMEASTPRSYALVTHVHNDHFDVESLKEILGERGYVICHESVATYVASRGLRVIPAELYVPVTRGGFIFTAVPAEDGFGDEQVGWVVAVNGRKFCHFGDTLWHGKFGIIGEQYGPFDAAFLPINGVRASSNPAVDTPAVLTPSQAVDAALLLAAQQLVPIHFGLNDPPGYVEVENPLQSLRAEADRKGVVVTHLVPGQSVNW